ncbi:MAG: HNH endonuclease [Rhodocyclaceae bacterium]|nr:HNH endonuclease [Rhodocyclaceae bacterium]
MSAHRAAPPSPEAQLQWLNKLQRLFSEGDFTATYKFALLIALADLAVEKGTDDGEPLALTFREIATNFVELYWQQTVPYVGLNRPHPQVLVAADSGAEHTLALHQSNGRQAAVVSAIAAFRRLNPGLSLATLRVDDGGPFRPLIGEVARTVAAQPARYLQNLAGQADRFLYEPVVGGLCLLPGVAYCLRRFQPLVQQLARNGWVRQIKAISQNARLLGETDDLEAFLFDTPRQALDQIGAELRKLCKSQCFYCGGRVHEADVDHFVPFSLYPRDLMHNFVLAHPACNRSKSDTLAALPHLERWREYIDRHDDDLREIGDTVGRPADATSSLAVARWGYGNGASGGARAWLRSMEYVPVTPAYLTVL